jgi:chromosomal replication initiation ATPase DnaA
MKNNERRAHDIARATLAGNLAAYAFGADGADMMCATRGAAHAAFVRQVAMYLAHVAFEMSLSRIAYAFERDRSTVAHACRVIEDKRDESEFDARIGALEEALRLAPAPLTAPQRPVPSAAVRDSLRLR